MVSNIVRVDSFSLKRSVPGEFCRAAVIYSLAVYCVLTGNTDDHMLFEDLKTTFDSILLASYQMSFFHSKVLRRDFSVNPRPSTVHEKLLKAGFSSGAGSAFRARLSV